MPNQYTIVPYPIRLWSRVVKPDGPDGCWIWVGSRHTRGYGLLSVNGVKCKTHRLAWELTNGPIPEGMFVCHTCDNPPCCNPAHLWLGTHQDNMVDRHEKGRDGNVFGEAHGMAHCTEEKVREMRRLYADGVRCATITRMFGMSNSATYSIVKGLTWKHVR